ncbi:hypothetical protein E4U42_003392 [Claviceps africana]|uniref:Uncharacterized protein n=1 Tax=Claviceps africana TaxID=83212 RepID=A0A8K0J809_9HYPO|nr:hypothetical protein E4U42_003392 [Claviceps africana]
MENNKSRASGFSLIAILRHFLGQLRQWIRGLWKKGQTKSKTEPSPGGQEKVSEPRETLDTAGCESDHDSSAPIHTPAPETPDRVQEPSMDDETLKKTPSVHEETHPVPKQHDASAVQDEAVTQEESSPKEESTVDYTTHERAPVVEEQVHKQVHTVYHLERTRSNHTHEHFYHIQPIIDTSEDTTAQAVDK